MASLRHRHAAHRVLFLMHASKDSHVRRPKPYTVSIDSVWLHRAANLTKGRVEGALDHLVQAGLVLEWQRVLDGSYAVLLAPPPSRGEQNSTGLAAEAIQFDQEGASDGQGE